MWEDDKQADGKEVPVRVVDRRRFHETPDGDIEENTAAAELLDRRPGYVQELEETKLGFSQKIWLGCIKE